MFFFSLRNQFVNCIVHLVINFSIRMWLASVKTLEKLISWEYYFKNFLVQQLWIGTFYKFSFKIANEVSIDLFHMIKVFVIRKTTWSRVPKDRENISLWGYFLTKYFKWWSGSPRSVMPFLGIPLRKRCEYMINWKVAATRRSKVIVI